ncbi:hypothetical protein B5C26_21550 [Photorhabdus luminescens]|nr:hypothetical protein B5C26_21550 [Photorhabdus luminescens]
MLFFQIRRSLGQNCRLQLKGDRYCSILPFVDSIISIDRKLITLDTGFIRYNTDSQSVIMIPKNFALTSIFYSDGINCARNNSDIGFM